eukprot:3552645-Rhodomonas_salina.2
MLWSGLACSDHAQCQHALKPTPHSGHTRVCSVGCGAYTWLVLCVLARFVRSFTSSANISS